MNPMIALQARAPQFDAPDPNAQTNRMMQVLQMGSMLDQADMNRLKVAEYKKGVQRKNKMLSLLDTDYAKPEDREAALMRGGFVEEASKLSKDRREGAKLENESLKAQAEAQAKQVETARKRVEGWGQAMGFVRQNPTPEAAQGAVQHMVNIGLLDDQQARLSIAPVLRNPTPEAIQQWATVGFRAAMSTKDQLPQYQTRNTGGTTDTLAIDPVTGQVQVANSVQNTQSPDNAATVAEQVRAHNMQNATQIRGQNLTDARSREMNAQGKTQIVETPQGFVIVDKNTGQSRPATGADGQPLKGKANDRVMTDAQAKANLFGTRMQESDRILNGLEGEYMPGAVNAKMAAGEVPGVGELAGYIGNLMLSESGQQAEQAQRDFINAVLRRESGAVISPQEFSNGQKQYFPQPGDTPAVLAQKKRNRALAISGMEAEVPGGFRAGPSLTNATGNTGGATGSFDAPAPSGAGRVVDFNSLR